MKRVLILVAAAATLLTTFVGAVEAREDRGRGWGRGGEGRHERVERGRGPDGAGPPGQLRRMPRDRGDRGPDYDRGRRYDPQPRYEPDPEIRRRTDPRNRPQGYVAPGRRLPPGYRGEVLRDPGRYRLRTPPPGYDWVGVGPDIYLVQRSTGMVLDAIPGGF
jgi:Ni/Co efflux regulator RcnB